MTGHAVDRARAYVERSRGAHAAYSLHYHLVWSTRARRPVLVDAVATALHDCLLRAGEQPDLHLLAFHVEPDHVHLLFSPRPTLAVAEAVTRLKGASSRHRRQVCPELLALPGDALWNSGYFVRSLGAVNVAQAKAYLDRQRSHHAAGERAE
jgi:putative transposase